MKAIYKCRLCGKNFSSIERATYNIAVHITTRLSIGLIPDVRDAPNIMKGHACNGGGIGLADFQGWEKEEGDTEE